MATSPDADPRATHMLRTIALALASDIKQERQLAAALDQLDRTTVRKASALEYARYAGQPHRCHHNAVSAAARAPGRVTAVHGWRIVGDTYVAHSVIALDGALVCITPETPGLDATFAFAIDPFMVAPLSNPMAVMRNGRRLPNQVRTDPAGHNAVLRHLRHRLLHGVPFDEALRLAEVENDARMQRRATQAPRHRSA